MSFFRAECLIQETRLDLHNREVLLSSNFWCLTVENCPFLCNLMFNNLFLVRGERECDDNRKINDDLKKRNESEKDTHIIYLRC